MARLANERKKSPKSDSNRGVLKQQSNAPELVPLVELVAALANAIRTTFAPTAATNKESPDETQWTNRRRSRPKSASPTHGNRASS
jgi:hypothetical protein